MGVRRPSRRFRLVPKGGVECFEFRVVAFIRPNGRLGTDSEITVPDGSDEPSLAEVLGALKYAELQVLRAYKELP